MPFAPNDNEFRFPSPEAFVGINNLRYAEIRRDPNLPTPLSGNATDSTPLLSKEYDRLRLAGEDVHDNRQIWMRIQKDYAQARLGYAATRLGFAVTCVPRGAHDPHALPISLADSWKNLYYKNSYESRPKTDATFSSQEGFGSVFTPGDCVVANVAFVKHGKAQAIVQIHAGRRGLMGDYVGRTFTRLNEEGYDSRNAAVYIGPYLRTNYTVYDSYLDELKQIKGYEDFISGDPSCPEFDMGALAVSQLVDAGVKASNIDSCPDDTWDNSTLYSYLRNHYQPTTIPVGRIGVMFGLQ